MIQKGFGLKWSAKEIQEVSVETLIPYDRNPRIHSEEQIESLANSIRQWGFTIPILVDEKFLVNDIENTELGQTIKSMDLEQCRYFNKYYGINDLLNINVNTNDGFRPYNYRDDEFIWDGETNKYSEETSVGQIFIGDNLDLDLKQSCKLELNTGRLSGKTILDTSGNSNKGILIGDYKVKKKRKGEPMRRDSFIKVPKKTSNRRGAL